MCVFSHSRRVSGGSQAQNCLATRQTPTPTASAHSLFYGILARSYPVDKDAEVW